MLIAEIRRKIADLEDIDPEEVEVVQRVRAMLRETKEDLLTADVFGVLKYLPRAPYLQTVLKAIADRNPHCGGFGKSIQRFDGDLESCDFRFWPSYQTPEGLPGSTTEPDVEISSPDLLMFFEAKLHSGFGQHQVERELAVGLDQAREREFFLVLVTPSIFPPRIGFEGRRLSIQDYLRSVSGSPGMSKSEAKRIKANSYRVLWINWHAIMSALDSAYVKHCLSARKGPAETLRVRDMLGDLNELMGMRGLRPFGGLSHIMRTDTPLRSGLCLMPGVPIMPESRFKGLTANTLRKLGDFLPFSIKKSFVFPYSEKERSKGHRVGALMDLSTVVQQFSASNHDHVGFSVRSSGKDKRMMSLSESVKE